jgi:hypothetical protein
MQALQMPDFCAELANGGIVAEHRFHIIPLITRILFARLSDRKGGAGSTKLLAVRRAAALTFMSNFEPEELSTLCNLMLQPFSVLLSMGSTPESAPRGIAATRALATVPAGNVNSIFAMCLVTSSSHFVASQVLA